MFIIKENTSRVGEVFSLVGMTLMRWNTIKRELISFWEIYTAIKSSSLALA